MAAPAGRHPRELVALAHARLGEAVFARMSTFEHEVALCVLAGDSCQATALYLETSPAKLRRTLARLGRRFAGSDGAVDGRAADA